MKRKTVLYLILAVSAVFMLSGHGSRASAEPKTYFGDSVAAGAGKGTLRSYIQLSDDGKPVSLGVVFGKAMLEGLPSVPNTTSRCFDVNGNGTIERGECVGDFETILNLPKEAGDKASMPLKWIAVSWNPEGHSAPAPPPWAAPHFDFHFYMVSKKAVQDIHTGKCGELIDCGDFKRATMPVPAQYLPKNHINVDAAVPAMGNHLIDTTTPELGNPPAKFTHTFIYGAYDGHITFYEPMITSEFLAGLTKSACKSLNLPEAWEVSGYYPTEYCIRYVSGRGEYTVSLEKFVYREVK